MNRIFSIAPPFRVPDGTWVSPFLNAKDSQSDLPFDLLDGFSIAAGIIEPLSCSRIHVMPLVTQVTFLRSGALTVKMKSAVIAEAYGLQLTSGQAVLTEPGVFFQLINNANQPCEVLYIVNPAYVFDMDAEGRIRYDDAVVLDEDWEQLAAASWQPAQALATPQERAEATQRLSQSKPNASQPCLPTGSATTPTPLSPISNCPC